VFEIQAEIEESECWFPNRHLSTVDTHGESVQNSTCCHEFKARQVSVPYKEKKQHEKGNRNGDLFPGEKLKEKRNGKKIKPSVVVLQDVFDVASYQ